MMTITVMKSKKIIPFPFLQIKANLPDNTPAAGVPVEVCAAGKCNNMTTADDGLFTAVVSSDNTNRIFVSRSVLYFLYNISFLFFIS